MTNRESEIFKLLKENPLISQISLAEKLGIKRSSVAVHLSNLMKKGLLKGRGYVINENPYICVVGGSNVDIVGFSSHKIIDEDANLGHLKISMGGVGRNIAENLVRLGLNTKLICVLGDDIYGKLVVDNCDEIGIDIHDSLFLKNMQSSVYLAIMNENNDLALGLAAMNIYDEMTTQFIQKKKVCIKNAKLVVLDTNISEEILVWLTKNIPNQRYILDTVSMTKSKKAKRILNYLYMIKVNILEAEALSNIKISTSNDTIKAARYFHQQGISKVFITLGKKGVYYSDHIGEHGQIRPKKHTIINTNGAGDAFVAGVVYAETRNLDIKDSAKVGMACSYMAVEHVDTVNPKINEERILKFF
jgi:pseudouridine kinase